MIRIVVTVPIASMLSANGRGATWHAKAAKTSDLRNLGFLAARLVVWSENGMLRLASVPQRKFGAVEVTMSHGYDDMPAIVTAITAALEATEAGPRREQVGSVSAEWSEAGAVGVLDEYQMRALDRYRLGPRP